MYSNLKSLLKHGWKIVSANFTGDKMFILLQKDNELKYAHAQLTGYPREWEVISIIDFAQGQPRAMP